MTPRLPGAAFLLPLLLALPAAAAGPMETLQEFARQTSPEHGPPECDAVEECLEECELDPVCYVLNGPKVAQALLCLRVEKDLSYSSVGVNLPDRGCQELVAVPPVVLP